MPRFTVTARNPLGDTTLIDVPNASSPTDAKADAEQRIEDYYGGFRSNAWQVVLVEEAHGDAFRAWWDKMWEKQAGIRAQRGER